MVFGHDQMHWMDQRFARRYANRPKSEQPPRDDWAYTRYEWRLWLKALLATGFTSALLLLTHHLVEDFKKTKVLLEWFPVLYSVLIIWLIFGPLWYSVLPKKPKQSNNRTRRCGF